MLFAAGFGTRMGALTANRPKPLISVAGRPLIDHALAVADAAGVTDTVVNLHYLGDQITDHLQGRNLAFSWEREQILETGGGLKQALPQLGAGPVLTLNTDAVWTGKNPLSQLLQAWIRHLHHADVGLNRAKRIVLCSNARLGQRIKKGTFAHVGQAYNATLQTHKKPLKTG
jgi:NDP-sugar pyrophosphorylase family protein